MKLSLLLTLRPALLRQARLSNLAFAYWKLSDFAGRIARARLQGEINLKQATPDTGRYWASLTALEGNQSVIEEHFSDEDLMDFADAIALTTGESNLDLTFRIEQLSEKFLAPLRLKLEQGGIVIEPDSHPVEEPNRGGSSS
jgi:hypothetical protein